MTIGAMSSGQAQVINPILSTHARGYTNLMMIGTALLPFATIPARSVLQLNFGKNAFRKYMQTRRAPGAEVPMLQFGYGTDPVALKQEALAGLVPVETAEDAARTPGIDMGAMAVKTVQDIIALGREVEIATKVRNPAIYDANHKLTLAGASRWTDPASDPKEDVKAAKESVRRSIGRDPNVLAISSTTFNALDDHPKILEKIKYTSSDSITVELLARYFDVEKVVVGKAVALADTADDDAMADDVWGDDAILAYVPAGGNYMVPAYGYTYQLSGYPVVEQPYYVPGRRSWVYPTIEEYRPYVTGAEGGFLFQNAGNSA